MTVQKISPDEYREQYWPHIENRIVSILRPAGNACRFSGEEILRFVYNACCAGYSPQLFEDVRQTVSAHLLGHVAPAVAASTTPEQFVNELLSSWQSWQTHARTLQPMFAYLERMYLQTKLHTTFAEEMNGLYVECVARRCGVYARLTELVSALSDHLLSANSLRLPVLLPLINGQCPELARAHPQLFADYVPELKHLAPVHPHTTPVTNRKRDGEAMDGSDAQLQKRIQLDPAINSPALG